MKFIYGEDKAREGCWNHVSAYHVMVRSVPFIKKKNNRKPPLVTSVFRKLSGDHGQEVKEEALETSTYQ